MGFRVPVIRLRHLSGSVFSGLGLVVQIQIVFFTKFSRQCPVMRKQQMREDHPGSICAIKGNLCIPVPFWLLQVDHTSCIPNCIISQCQLCPCTCVCVCVCVCVFEREKKGGIDTCQPQIFSYLVVQVHSEVLRLDPALFNFISSYTCHPMWYHSVCVMCGLNFFHLTEVHTVW